MNIVIEHGVRRVRNTSNNPLIVEYKAKTDELTKLCTLFLMHLGVGDSFILTEYQLSTTKSLLYRLRSIGKVAGVRLSLRTLVKDSNTGAIESVRVWRIE